METWIWLPEKEYPANQETVVSALTDTTGGHYTVAEFHREYAFGRRVARARLRVSADTAFQLYVNGAFVMTGPACVGGDFIGNDTPRDNYYAFEHEIRPDADRLSFFARVRMMPVQICEYSKGHGGFMLSAILTFEDGTEQVLSTDESWQVRKNGAYCAPRQFDGRILPDAYVPARVVEDIWHAATAPIPARTERTITPEGGDIALNPGEEKTVRLELSRIYAGFVRIEARTEGELLARVSCREQEEKGSEEQALFVSDGEYRGFSLHSAGNLLVRCENHGKEPARLVVSFLETHYPVTEEADTYVSDEALTQVLRVCKHTLRICRQTHHLDSPRHCEPLACTGDYCIEALMTPFAFGDMRLAAFDVERTALLLTREDGRMFHTTYSCIWVKMLYETYMATGEKDLLTRCEPALGLLLRRFQGYLGENGLIETPPDYMFVDWIYIDGLSMHHPPKALGQSCLNMFYCCALQNAAKVYRALSLQPEAARCDAAARSLRRAINEWLFDPEKGMYFEGLNTPTEEALLGGWMPRNVEKRYYLKHSNILAACMGVCDDETGRELVRRIMEDEIGGDCQPYFLHYLLEAIDRLGLRERYTRKVLEQWKEPVRECGKGLTEGFVKPEPSYHFDHSHAWGGTPLYSLPKALLGLTILEPGMRKIRLAPSLLGLENAHVELLTPMGKLTCDLQEGKAPRLCCPSGLEVVWEGPGAEPDVEA